MPSWLPRTPVQRWVEGGFATAIVGGLIYTMGFLVTQGYLPQPYFYDPTDTWMDWFNTSLWARDQGAYDTWATIYPPISFVFLRLFGLEACHAGADGGSVRDCDWLAVGTLHAFYIIDVVLIAWTFYKLDRRTALPRALALGAGLPMLYGLDRGNLVIVTFAFFVLAHGILLRSARLRWLAAGIAINFKIYLIASIFPYLLRRRWRWFEGAVLATVAVYVATWGILGIGSPLQIIDNVKDFTGIYQAVNFLDLWYAGTYGPALSLLSGGQITIVGLLGSGMLETLLRVLPLALLGVQATIALAAGAAWLRPERVPMFRLVGLATAFALITSEAGGYTQTMVLFFALFERWQGIGRRWAIVACYILCLPFDVILYRIPPLTRESFLGGAPQVLEYAAGWGPLLRPGIIMSIPFALACVTIRQVWLDARAHGLGNRRRFADFGEPAATAAPI